MAFQIARYPRNFALEQVASHFEQAKQGRSAIRSADAGVGAKENTSGTTQVVAKRCSDYSCSMQQILETPLPCCPGIFDTVPELHDLTAHLSRCVNI